MWGTAGGPGWRGPALDAGPVGNEDERASLGIRFGRALSLVSRVRVGAGAVRGIMCGTWLCSGIVSAAQVGGLSG